MIWKLVLSVLCLNIVYVSVADPEINERGRKNQKYDVSSSITTMMSRIPLEGTAGWKQFSYLQKYPRFFDVTFAVGPAKSIVKAPELILIMASPVFERELQNRWENAAIENEEEIPLPDLNPEAFKLFVELTIIDSWSVEALNALQLTSNQLLHLISICHKYEMAAALKNLTELAADFLTDFGNRVKPEEFLLLSQAQLGAVLDSDELVLNETEVFNYARRWAEEQCRKQDLVMTGANIRLVLGEVIYSIRFPLMSIVDFGKVMKLIGLLVMEEVAEIVELMGMEGNYSISNNTWKFKFKTEKRKGSSFYSKPTVTTNVVDTRTAGQFTSVPTGTSIISVAQVFPVVDTPFVCDGSESDRQFFTDFNNDITLHGVGFLGPIDADTFYDVTVQIYKRDSGQYSAYTNQMRKHIFAQKSRTFYFIFDQPVVLVRLPDEQRFYWYYIRFSLKGPNTKSLQHQKFENKKINDGNVGFTISWLTPQLVEFAYKL